MSPGPDEEASVSPQRESPRVKKLEAAEARSLEYRQALEQCVDTTHPSGFATCKICGGTNINGREWSDIKPGDPVTHHGPGAYRKDGCPVGRALSSDGSKLAAVVKAANEIYDNRRAAEARGLAVEGEAGLMAKLIEAIAATRLDHPQHPEDGRP